jgi:hypothetical protein
MLMFKRGWVVLLLISASACGSRNTSTSPSPTPTATTFSLSGTVTDNTTGSGISGATVTVVDGVNAGKSTTTSSSGSYSFTGLQPGGFTVTISASNYASQSKGVGVTSNQALSFQLYPRFLLAGRVTDSTTSTSLFGATVSINGHYATTTDSLGNYTVTGFLDYGSNTNFTYVSANNYANDYRYIRGTTQNVRLYRIERITAGDSTVVTVAPDDTLCVNNVQDTPGVGQDYVCRSVRMLVPSDGVMTLEAVAIQGGAHPPLEVEINSTPVNWAEPFPNPTSFPVTAGNEVVANVEMVLGSTTSQSFTLTTSMARR